MTEDDVGRIGGFVGMVAKRTRVSLLRVIICGRAPNVSDADGSPTSEYLVECHEDKLDRPRLEPPPAFPTGGGLFGIPIRFLVCACCWTSLASQSANACMPDERPFPVPSTS